MTRSKVRTGGPVDTAWMPSERFPLANRPKPIQKQPPARVPEPELDEVSVSEIEVGDVIRVRLYEGVPGRWFASQSRQGEDLIVVRIENAMQPSNGYYRAYPIRVAMSACGKCFTLDPNDDCYRHRAQIVRTVGPTRVVRPALPMPAPLALAASNEVLEGVYEEP